MTTTKTPYKPMEFVTPDLVLRLLGRLPDPFSSHHLIDEIRSRHRAEYEAEVEKKRAAGVEDPEAQVHSDIASRLNYWPFDEHVRQVGRVWSKSIRGTLSRIALWGKKAVLTEDTAPLSDHR